MIEALLIAGGVVLGIAGTLIYLIFYFINHWGPDK